MPGHGAGHFPVGTHEIDDEGSPALRIALARVTTPRSVFDTAGPVLRKST
jgi:hypothetical protein